MKRALAGLLALPLAAQDPDALTVNPNRPTFATPARTTQEGVLELEAGLQRTLFKDGSRSDFEPILLKLGQTGRFEWRLGWNGYLRQTAPDGSRAQGFSDPTLGFQWHPLDQDRLGFDGAVGYFHKFAMADAAEGLGSGRADDTLALLASKDLGAVHLDVNYLHGWIGQPAGGRAGQDSGTASASWPLAGPWGMGAELYTIGPLPGLRRDTALLAYASYQLSPRAVFDAGFDRGVSNGAPRWNLFCGVTCGLGRLFHPKAPR
ncbi:MAG TPA: hypothetical protein VL181_02490 [Holophagaceae bacterium]|nr:hypothetical protein [Holophagaceae bacterium]